MWFLPIDFSDFLPFSGWMLFQLWTASDRTHPLPHVFTLPWTASFSPYGIRFPQWTLVAGICCPCWMDNVFSTAWLCHFSLPWSSGLTCILLWLNWSSARRHVVSAMYSAVLPYALPGYAAKSAWYALLFSVLSFTVSVLRGDRLRTLRCLFRADQLILRIRKKSRKTDPDRILSESICSRGFRWTDRGK